MILRNSLKTPDGTEIVSRSRHDYVTHKDKNGKTYCVDGGFDYLRRSNNGDEIDTSLTLEDPIEKLRKKVQWGTYGIKGNSPLKYFLIKDLEVVHIENILKDFVEGKNPYVFYQYVELFCRELEYREKENN